MLDPAAATSADAIAALKEEGLLRTEGKGRCRFAAQLIWQELSAWQAECCLSTIANFL